MFLATAQASGPKLLSIFSHSWGSSNLAIPQSAAAAVACGEIGAWRSPLQCAAA